jgi:hypothetical protein
VIYIYDNIYSLAGLVLLMIALLFLFKVFFIQDLYSSTYFYYSIYSSIFIVYSSSQKCQVLAGSWEDSGKTRKFSENARREDAILA